jgi:two-component system OmpR family response regulator
MNQAISRTLEVDDPKTSDRQYGASRGRILLIEDDPEIAEEVAGDLMERGYDVRHAVTGSLGLAEARRGRFDILIVDLLLPDCDGLSIIQTLRAEDITVPVLVVSALSAVNDRIRGLKFGGDDYVTKPFAILELAARVEAPLRRPVETRASLLHVGALELDLIEHEAHRNGQIIPLSGSEFRLLEYFMRRPDQVVTRDMLLEDVWHYRFIPQSNLIDVHVGRLRRKVDNFGDKPMLISIRGVGFILRDPR